MRASLSRLWVGVKHSEQGRLKMGWINFDDVLGQMQAFGLDIEAGDIVVGQRRRCRHTDGGREKRGWFQLYEISKSDGSGLLIVGSFGAFFGAENMVQKVELKKDDKQSMTAEQMAALKARIAEDKKRAEAETRRRNERAAKEAEVAWRKCLPAGESAYLVRKCVEGFGVRYSPSGAMAIPMLDVSGRIHGLQIIRAEKSNGRDKDFWPVGLAKKGHFYQFGGIPDGVLLIVEGYATGASVHMATGLPVAVAFDAGNLMPVAQALHKRYSRTKIVICADDDYRTDGNPGVKHAESAALAVGGTVVVPVFADERPADRKGPTDFNDLHVLEGLQSVKSQLEAHLSGNAIAISKAPARGEQGEQGGGEKRERRAAMSVMELGDIVERFVPLDDGTGDYVFDTWTNKVAKRSQMITLLPAGVRADDIKRHPYWVSRGAYYLDQVGFDPSEKDRNVKLNTWQGWPMKPKSGSCDKLLELIEYLCGKEENSREVFQWLLCWLAYPLQNPGAKMASAVIMHGPQGTGKSTVFQTVAKIYGDYATVLNQRGLEDKFNSDWSDSKLFILAEEVVTRAEMWHIKNELKELVTGEWIRINPKNIAAYRQRNQVNICYLSNENQPLPLDNDDRRHLVIYTPPALSEAYYDDVNIELENGGIEAFYHYLVTLDISTFHPKKRPPMTVAKQKLIALSAASEVRFINDWITEELGYPVAPCLSADLYAAYLKYCKINGETRPRPSNQFHGAVAHMPGWDKRKARIYPHQGAMSTEPKPITFPPEHVMSACGTAMQPGANSTQWLTDCVANFREKLTGGESERYAA